MNFAEMFRRPLMIVLAAAVTLAAATSFVGTADAQTRTDTVCTYNGAIANTNPAGCQRQIRIVDRFPGTPATYHGTWQSANDFSVFRVECFHASSWETWCVLGEFLFANLPVTVTAVAAVVPNPTPSTPLPTAAQVAETAAAIEIAFTGAESSVLGYVGAGLIAFGTVALGVRRRLP